MVGRNSSAPRRGDVVWIMLNPQAGHEQLGRRPAVVLSPEAYNQKAGLAILCPVTARIKGYPFEVVVPPGLPVSGAVLADQVKSLEWKARKAEFICAMPSRTTAEILAKVRTLLN